MEADQPPEPHETWIDVGAHLGQGTLPAARLNPGIRVYAFEPNLRRAMELAGLLPNFIVLPMAVGEHNGVADFYLNEFDAASSLLPLHPEGLAQWIGREQLRVAATLAVPVIRLDTFLQTASIRSVDYLHIDAQGMDLAVVRSAGERLKDIRKIMLEVQITPLPLYVGAAGKDAILEFLNSAGFELVGCQRQSHDQEENLTFYRCAR